MSQITLKWSNNTLKGVKLYSRTHLMLLVGSFAPFTGVILDIGDYTLNV